MNEHQINGNLRCEVQELNVQVAVLNSRLESSKDALKLQAQEYERRLDILNHAHEEAKDVQAKYGSTYLTIDRFDRTYTEYLEWRRNVDTEIVSIKASALRYSALIAVVFTFITLGIQIYHAWKG